MLKWFIDVGTHVYICLEIHLVTTFNVDANLKTVFLYASHDVAA